MDDGYLKEYETYGSINLLFRNAIEQACDEGYKCYNLGLSGNLDGVRKFKESFGAEKIDVNRYRILSPFGKIAYWSFERTSKILKRMKR